ncbi:hypothetical protein Ddc_17048 [Ditylenchus destructor]|nr:hypothetical protein Ddc_17048 [Ditylenchus destructor]
MDLKVSDEFQMVKTIHCCRAFGIEEVLKRDFGKFILKDEKNYEHTVLFIELINNTIQKKMQITVAIFDHNDRFYGGFDDGCDDVYDIYNQYEQRTSNYPIDIPDDEVNPLLLLKITNL